MLPDGSKWIDSDMHLAEPGNLWDDYIDPAYRDVSLALSRAYNRWLADFCSADPARLKMNALVPIGDVDAAIAELRHVVRDFGAVGVSPGSSRPEIRLDDPRYEPFWAEAESLGV